MEHSFADLLRRYSIAIFSTLTATWGRMELEPLLNNRVPFGLFFISTLLTAWLAGTGPALLAAVLSVLAAAHFIIPPGDMFWPGEPADIFSLVIYTFVTLASILLFHRTSSQRALAEESARENARLNSDLQEADRRKDEFLALLAHELRNPLAPIRTAVETLDQSVDDSTRAGVGEVMRRQINQLVRLVDDLLDVSRYVQGKLQLQIEALDLREAVRLAVEIDQSELDQRSHRLALEMPGVPIYVRGDSARLTQVVSNLLHNAAKYTPRGGHIQLEAFESEGSAIIRVRDDGVGIPSELKARIFELFTQVNSSRNRREGGLGIGLALVRQLVELHEGSIEVDSEGIGRGSTFTVHIPLLPPSRVVRPESAESPEPRQRPRPPGEETRILLVDDNQDSSQMLCALLEMEGYVTRSAADGFDGIEQARAFYPDVILLDIGMPGMDGYEVARHLRRDPDFRSTKIIAISGWGGAEDRRRSDEAGIDVHLVKPFPPQELFKLLHESTASPAPPVEAGLSLPQKSAAE